jgi:glycosyltransferase involved in cell wall biosynthesis
MKISVIVTVFNLEKYIAAALDSILSQTRPPDEVIVVDDCSTDNSAQIILSYGNKIKYVKMPENSGVLPAFIKGIDESTGEMLGFLDGDDIWLPQKLELVEKAFIENPNRVLVTHDYEVIDGESKLRPYGDNTHINTARIVKESGGDLKKMDVMLRNSMLCFKGVWMGSAFSIRRDLIDFEVYKKWVFNLPDPGMSHQDQPLAAFIMVNYINNEVYFINQKLFQYRLFGFNSSGVSNTVTSALRSVNRSYATLVRVLAMVATNTSLKEENKTLRLHIMYNRYLHNLYSKKYIAACKKYGILAFQFWNFKQAIHEAKRVGYIIIFGSDKFLKVKSGR